MGEVETTHRNLGELAVMASRTEKAERRILDQAQRLLAAETGKLGDLRTKALAGDNNAAADYQTSIAEIGRLERVVSQAKKVLGDE